MLAKLATGNRFRIWQALQRQKQRRHAGASALVISSLQDLSGLRVEFQPDPLTMNFAGSDIVAWDSMAGSELLTLSTFGDGVGSPMLMPNALGPGRTAVYFQGGKMTADVDWAFADMTAIFVGNLDVPNLGSSWAPRWLGLGNYGRLEEDWASADTWVVACYDTIFATNGFVSDRNSARPIDLYFDPDQNYLVVTRKQAGTIKVWLRPFGGETITMTGATSSAGLAADTLNVGGNMEPQNLSGAIGHIGLWNRGLSDTEVLAAMNYLGSLYE